MERKLLGPSIIKMPAIPDKIGLGGAVAGFFAGLGMVILSPILSFLTGISLWEPVKMIATVVYPASILDTPGFMLGPVLVGTALHFAVSILLGAIFGILFNRVFHLTTAFGMPIQVGLVYGLMIWMFVYMFVLPSVNPILRNSYQPPFVAQHLVFGVLLGAAYMMVRRLPYRYNDAR